MSRSVVTHLLLWVICHMLIPNNCPHFEMGIVLYSIPSFKISPYLVCVFFLKGIAKWTALNRPCSEVIFVIVLAVFLSKPVAVVPGSQLTGTVHFVDWGTQTHTACSYEIALFVVARLGKSSTPKWRLLQCEWVRVNVARLKMKQAISLHRWANHEAK